MRQTKEVNNAFSQMKLIRSDTQMRQVESEMRQAKEVRADNILLGFSLAVFSYAIGTFMLFSLGF